MQNNVNYLFITINNTNDKFIIEFNYTALGHLTVVYCVLYRTLNKIICVQKASNYITHLIKSELLIKLLPTYT